MHTHVERYEIERKTAPHRVLCGMINPKSIWRNVRCFCQVTHLACSCAIAIVSSSPASHERRSLSARQTFLDSPNNAAIVMTTTSPTRTTKTPNDKNAFKLFLFFLFVSSIHSFCCTSGRATRFSQTAKTKQHLTCLRPRTPIGQHSWTIQIAPDERRRRRTEKNNKQRRKS